MTNPFSLIMNNIPKHQNKNKKDRLKFHNFKRSKNKK